MEVGKLTVNRRYNSGKGAAHKLRAQGRVPGVCYGASTSGAIEPIAVDLSVKELRGALDPVRKQNTVIQVTIVDGDKGSQTVSALLKEYQLDPIRREVTHVDLLAIDPDREVLAVIPIEFFGKHAGAINGGQLHPILRNLEVRAKPANIPVKIAFDVAPLDIGDVIHVSDLVLPEGVQSVTGASQTVMTCTAPEVDRDAPAAAAAAPEAAKAPAKGAAPAKAGAAPAKAAAAPAKAPAKK